MNIQDQIRELLRRYTVERVDQNCEGVLDWHDSSSVAGTEESGHWVWTEVTITYWVHPDVEPRRGVPNLRTYRWDASLGVIISQLEKMESERNT